MRGTAQKWLRQPVALRLVVLELLAVGWTFEQIRNDFPFIEPEDVQQVQGLSRSEYLRREVSRLAQIGASL